VHVLPGQRLPLVPPIGTVFVAWSPEENVEHWLSPLGSSAGKTATERHRKSLASVAARGYSVGLEGGGRASRSAEGRTLTLQESIQGLKTEEYAPLALDGATTYRANHIGAPVFGPDGEVAIAMFLIGFPGRISGAEVDRIADRLTSAAARVTKTIHGRRPTGATGD
jgi:DNA-binding IclR family transcriptional regulator